MRFLGVDLAWGEGSTAKRAKDTGVVALSESGAIIDAGWTVGIDSTLEWVEQCADADTLLFVDAPLVVENAEGARACEIQVSQGYMRWLVGANSTNLAKTNLGSVTLRRSLEEHGWRYSDGRKGPPLSGRVVSECYPYTTIVGVPELGYDVRRPTYKRKPRMVLTAEWRALRATACDDLIQRIGSLAVADPPIDLASHAETASLLTAPSPAADVAYKRREDIIDAALCAWTAAYWWRHGEARSQVLGVTPNAEAGVALATIIAPARPEQRIALRL